MSTRIKFIKTSYLKENSAIQGNVDDDILEPYIYKAQDIHIHQILGTALYNKLKSDVKAFVDNGTTIPTIYKTILEDYVQPCLLEWSTYEALPFISIKLTNKSVVKRNSEYSQPAELFELKYLRDSVRDMAEWQSKRLTNYLKENVGSIPEYQNPGSGLDTVRPNNSSYFGGVYLGNGKSGNCNYGTDLPD